MVSSFGTVEPRAALSPVSVCGDLARALTKRLDLTVETVQKVGGALGPPGRCSREFGMKWRLVLELVGPDGIVCVHEVCGRAAVAEYAPQIIGLTLEEGKHLLAALQVHLVQAQAEDHSRRRRRCQRCGAQRPLKDQRSRRLVSSFGTVEVRAPRFTPCRYAVTCRRTLNPIAEIMPTDARRSTSGPSQRWVRYYPCVDRSAKNGIRSSPHYGGEGVTHSPSYQGVC